MDTVDTAYFEGGSEWHLDRAGTDVAVGGRASRTPFYPSGADPNHTMITNFVLYQVQNGTVTDVVDETVASTTPDTTFRWDATAQQRIFNINTKNLTAKRTYYYAAMRAEGRAIRPLAFSLLTAACASGDRPGDDEPWKMLSIVGTWMCRPVQRVWD